MKVSGNKLSHQMPATDMAKETQGAKATLSNKETAGAKSEQTVLENRGFEKVNVSDRAQSMQKAKEMVSEQMQEVDMEKVTRLQKLIDEGRYSVDASQVADRLVNEHLFSAE